MFEAINLSIESFISFVFLMKISLKLCIESITGAFDSSELTSFLLNIVEATINFGWREGWFVLMFEILR